MPGFLGMKKGSVGNFMGIMCSCRGGHIDQKMVLAVNSARLRMSM